MGHTRSISWFGIIGSLAAIVHYGVAVSLESSTNISPAHSNIAGFVLAFPISYFGHSKFSFANHQRSHRQAFPKFFMVALAGFITNQILVLGLMHLFALPFWLVLGMVMVIVAASAYLLSRFWAFSVN
jgi:putative flippase GtrA